MSLHQPATQIFMMFDRVMFLSAGEMVYSGFPQSLMYTLNNLGFSSIDDNMAPSDLLISLLSFDNKSTEVDFLYHNISEDYDTSSDKSFQKETKETKETKEYKEYKETWRPFPSEFSPQGQFCLPRDVLLNAFDNSSYQLKVDDIVSNVTPSTESQKDRECDQ